MEIDEEVFDAFEEDELEEEKALLDNEVSIGEDEYADDDFVDEYGDDYEEDFENSKQSKIRPRHDSEYSADYEEGDDDEEEEEEEEEEETNKVAMLAAKLSALEARMAANELKVFKRRRRRKKRRPQVPTKPKRAWPSSSKHHVAPAVGAALRHIRAVATSARATALLGLDDDTEHSDKAIPKMKKKKKKKQASTYDLHTGHRIEADGKTQHNNNTHLFLMPRPRLNKAPPIQCRHTFDGLSKHEWFTVNQPEKPKPTTRCRPSPPEGYPTNAIARSARAYEKRCKQLQPDEVRERCRYLLSSGNFTLARARESIVGPPQRSTPDSASLLKPLREFRFLKEWDVLVRVEARPNRGRRQLSTRHDPARYEHEARVAADAALDALKEFCVRAAVLVDVKEGETKQDIPLGALEVQLAVCTAERDPPRLFMLHSKVATRTFPTTASVQRAVRQALTELGATSSVDGQRSGRVPEVGGALSWEFDSRAVNKPTVKPYDRCAQREEATQLSLVDSANENVSAHAVTVLDQHVDEEQGPLVKDVDEKQESSSSQSERNKTTLCEVLVANCEDEGVPSYFDNATNQTKPDFDINAGDPIGNNANTSDNHDNTLMSTFVDNPVPQITAIEEAVTLEATDQVENEIIKYFYAHEHAHLVDYVPVLIADGWDTLDTFEQFTEEDALRLDGVKRGHARIMAKIAKGLRDARGVTQYEETKNYTPATQKISIEEDTPTVQEKVDAGESREQAHAESDEHRSYENKTDEQGNEDCDEDEYGEHDFEEQEADEYETNEFEEDQRLDEKQDDTDKSYENDFDERSPEKPSQRKFHEEEPEQQIPNGTEVDEQEDFKVEAEQQIQNETEVEEQEEVKDEDEAVLPEFDSDNPDSTAARFRRELQARDDVTTLLEQYGDETRNIQKKGFERLLRDLNFEYPSDGGLTNILACIDLDGNALIKIDALNAFVRGDIPTDLDKMRRAMHAIVKETNGKYDAACLEQQLFHKYDRHYAGWVPYSKFCRAVEKLASRSNCTPEEKKQSNALAKVVSALWSTKPDDEFIDYVRWCSWLNPVTDFSKTRRRIARWAAAEVQRTSSAFDQLVEIHAYKYSTVGVLTQSELGVALRGAGLDVSTPEARLLRMAYGDHRLKDIFNQAAWDRLVHEGQALQAKKQSKISNEAQSAAAIYQPSVGAAFLSSRPSSASKTSSARPSSTNRSNFTRQMPSKDFHSSSPMVSLANAPSFPPQVRQKADLSNSSLSAASVPISSLTSLNNFSSKLNALETTSKQLKPTELSTNIKAPLRNAPPSTSLASLANAPKFGVSSSPQSSRARVGGVNESTEPPSKSSLASLRNAPKL